jgi:hypothetical protein
MIHRISSLSRAEKFDEKQNCKFFWNSKIVPKSEVFSGPKTRCRIHGRAVVDVGAPTSGSSLALGLGLITFCHLKQTLKYNTISERSEGFVVMPQNDSEQSQQTHAWSSLADVIGNLLCDMFTSALKRSGELIGGGSQARKLSGVKFKKSLKLKEVSPRYSNGMGDDGGG